MENSLIVLRMTMTVKKTMDLTVEILNLSASSILSKVSSAQPPKHLDTFPISNISTTSVSCFWLLKGLVLFSIYWEGNTLLIIASSSHARSYLTDISCSLSMFGWPRFRPRGDYLNSPPGIGPWSIAEPETWEDVPTDWCWLCLSEKTGSALIASEPERRCSKNTTSRSK